MTTTQRVRKAVRALSNDRLKATIKRLARNERTSLVVEEAIVEMRARKTWWRG